MVDAAALVAADREREGLRLAAAEAAGSFDLECGPLLRAFLVRAAAAEHLLVLNQHHVVSDAWSLEVFNRELAVLYEAFAAGAAAPLGALPELPIQYADFAVRPADRPRPARRSRTCSKCSRTTSKLAGGPGRRRVRWRDR